jgi:predicted O-methyltransferase YrrM
MNVFILCTGRRGSVTFIQACRHITNYSSAHESRVQLTGDQRLDYPANHIEADNRLSWFLGRLDETYGDDAIYVHLKREISATAKSFMKRWNAGIISAYAQGILMNERTSEMNDDDKMGVCMDYCHTINANITAFLKDKSRTMVFSLENATLDFKAFWEMIGAEGDYQKALSEWDTAYNASVTQNRQTDVSVSNHDRVESPTEPLAELVKTMSVHQRQMSQKIDQLHIHHEELYAQQNHIYSQVDALFSIFSLLNIRHPLPTMRGWPVSPDFVKVLMSVIFEIKPMVVAEAGSGVSTLISAYCLEKNGRGSVVSMDHDEQFAEQTRKNLVLHGLDSLATIHYCPLADMAFGDESYPWYAAPINTIPNVVDLLVIDGPPANMGAMVRYPALPVFFDRLADGAVVLLDDAARPGERKIVERWINEFNCFEYAYLDTEKGTVVLRKK